MNYLPVKKYTIPYKLAALVLIMALQGCATVFHNVKSTFTVSQDDEKLLVTDNSYAISFPSPTEVKNKKPVKDSGLSRPSSVIVFVTTAIIDDSVKLKNRVGVTTMDNREDFFVAEQAKAGYFNSTFLLGRTIVNPWKIVDIAIPAIFYAAFIPSPLAQENNPPGYIAPFVLYSVVAPIPIFFGAWKTYKRSYNLPALEPLPQRQPKENNFYVRGVDFSEKTDSNMRFSYPKYSDFANNHPKYSSPDEHGHSLNSVHFANALNKTLASWDFIDTTKHGLAYLYDRTMYVRCEVSSIAIYTVGYFTSFDITAKWFLYNPAGGKAFYDATFETSSIWAHYGADNLDFVTFTNDALSRSLAKFIQDDRVNRALHDSVYAAPNTEVWDTLKMTTSDSGRVSQLSDAIKAGVTVKNPNGNGSGCIISSDGYVVTNFHVVGSDTTKEVTLLTSKGDTLKATRVRNNISYDLALLKIKKPGSYKYFAPETSKDIPLGMDVFAIGTPTDVELGQTLSKGIISGQRKAGTKKIIQTDVAISPGNNGGALVNDKGAVIGIVNAKFIGEGIQGIGFAIPAYYLEEALKVKFAK